MTAEAINAWFTPFHFFTYLGVMTVGLLFYEQWRWTRKARGFIKVIVIHSDGSTHTEYCPKTGSYVQVKDPQGTTRLWPIGKLSTADVPYPDADFVPSFLKKNIRMTIVNEDDWEPMINRDPSQGVIANPAWLGSMAVQRVAEAFAVANEDVKDMLSGVTSRMRTVVTPQLFYIGTGVVLAVLAFALYQALPLVEQFEGTLEQVQQLAGDVAAIKQALGVR